jgi:hypothetical protein
VKRDRCPETAFIFLTRDGAYEWERIARVTHDTYGHPSASASVHRYYPHEDNIVPDQHRTRPSPSASEPHPSNVPLQKPARSIAHR